MNTIFTQGTIVKSNIRTEKNPLFVMVLWAQETSPYQFNGVVLYNADVDNNTDVDDDVNVIIPHGMVSNGWNTDMFEETDWIEFCKFMKEKLQF